MNSYFKYLIRDGFLRKNERNEELRRLPVVKAEKLSLDHLTDGVNTWDEPAVKIRRGLLNRKSQADRWTIEAVSNDPEMRNALESKIFLF